MIFDFLKRPGIRFIIVGGLGFIVNLGIFYLIADILKGDSNLAALVSFLVAVTHNYLLNHYWSFNAIVDSPISWKSYFKFVLVYCMGLGINLLVLNAIIIIFNPPLKVIAEFFGTLGGMLIDYFGSKKLVFLRTRNTNQ